MKTLLALILLFTLCSITLGQCPPFNTPRCRGPQGTKCCFFHKGVCCPSGIRCCPEGYKCDAQEKCVRR
ncbi:hypothetical protein L596_016261 [Steinernema carpocapsae]|uniref:Granulins domain-containing protein n=1 Tax=Steinernema carpocapsae TaxID=34508 RepID=A0A4U5NIF4_STECR|nr:hypothetical protein L596_016261 [Steinernema carpocapsae]